MPVLFVGVALVGLGLYRRHVTATCGDATAKEQDRR
jgi:hypothetical protein